MLGINMDVLQALFFYMHSGRYVVFAMLKEALDFIFFFLFFLFCQATSGIKQFSFLEKALKIDCCTRHTSRDIYII